MGKFIVLDIVFKANSLNYDQGVGNYQELKKITGWDGKQYTVVSRYALRYSILENSEFNLAKGDVLVKAGDGDKAVIQPSMDLLFSGKIVEYPEFDLFGYLITDTKPQNSREAPVKISHAISMTPYNYDTHFAGNLGLAKRIQQEGNKMDPNIFTVEEHNTYYVYSIVIDVERIGEFEFYSLKKVKQGKDVVWISFYDSEKKKWEVKVLEKVKNKKELKEKGPYDVGLDENDWAYDVGGEEDNKEAYIVTIKPKNDKKLEIKKERIVKLINSILTLKRNIKGRAEDLSPYLLILGLYEDEPYETFKDRIKLEEEYEETMEIEEIPDEHNPNKIVKKYRIIKTRKPVFNIEDMDENDLTNISKDNIIEKIEDFLKQNKDKGREIYYYSRKGVNVRFNNGKEGQ